MPTLPRSLLLPGHVAKAFRSCHLGQFQPGTWKKKAQGQVSSLLYYLDYLRERLPFCQNFGAPAVSQEQRHQASRALSSPEVSTQAGPCGHLGFLFCDWPGSTGLLSSGYTLRKLMCLPAPLYLCGFTGRACLFIKAETLISGTGWRCQSSDHRPDLAKNATFVARLGGEGWGMVSFYFKIVSHLPLTHDW